jgi:hypothetical protein
MADITYQDPSLRVRTRVDWGAIWAGVFAFIAIWSVFGMLGMAIFASSASPNAAQPVSGMNVGMGIWAIVLTIIAMYVAGAITGRLAGYNTRHEGVAHGMVMFGLSVVAVLIITILAGATLSGGSGVNGSVHNPYILGVFADLGWIGFIALFLGWLAALGGAASGSSSRAVSDQKSGESENLRHMRPAA